MRLEPEKVAFYSRSCQQATVVIRDFVESEVLPVMQSLVSATPFEEAVSGLYFRMVLWARSLAELADPQHFQAVRSGARSAFEHLIDITLLAREPSQAGKLYDFTMIAKYVNSLKLINYLDQHPEIDGHPYRFQRALVQDPIRKKEFENLIDAHWPPRPGKDRKAPDNWTGKSVAEKAKEAGPEHELTYRAEYGHDSWVVHSGIVFIDGMPQEFLVNLFGRGHILFQKSFLAATKIVCETLHLFEAKADLRRKLIDLENAPNTVMVQELALADLERSGQ